MVWLGPLVLLVLGVDSRQPPTLPWLLRALWLFPRLVILIESLLVDSSLHLPKYILTFDVSVEKEVEGRRWKW